MSSGWMLRMWQRMRIEEVPGPTGVIESKREAIVPLRLETRIAGANDRSGQGPLSSSRNAWLVRGRSTRALLPTELHPAKRPGCLIELTGSPAWARSSVSRSALLIRSPLDAQAERARTRTREATAIRRFMSGLLCCGITRTDRHRRLVHQREGCLATLHPAITRHQSGAAPIQGDAPLYPSGVRRGLSVMSAAGAGERLARCDPRVRRPSAAPGPAPAVPRFPPA